ncbi:hypothetical protein ACJZ2D_013631 [Fusarium nematophilum]
MGNICGKTEPEPFSQPGRVLGTAPPPASGTAPVPKKIGGPPRILGGGSSGEASGDPDEARRRAAEAAEASGKLQTQLTAQKKQTRADTLKDASEEQLRARESDQAAEARQWA